MATIGVDTGGTFTDLVRVEKGRIDVVKLPSTLKLSTSGLTQCTKSDDALIADVNACKSSIHFVWISMKSGFGPCSLSA